MRGWVCPFLRSPLLPESISCSPFHPLSSRPESPQALELIGWGGFFFKAQGAGDNILATLGSIKFPYRSLWLNIFLYWDLFCPS